MFAYLKGKLTEIEDGAVTVECGGVGFRILVPAGSPFDGIGEETIVYTHLSVTQDAFTLFGFASKDELTLFRMLITVSGVGPKGALGILSALSADELRYAIFSEDEAAISRAPGIGKKTAQKVILELRDKIDALSAVTAEIGLSAGGNISQEEGAAAEAIQALIALGYPAQEARRAVKFAAKENHDDVEAILSAALKEL